ncbi:hypothetical protein CEXT_362951 [Caerostris extrusa]|uniref:EGF-like domain-containing protein n=1 Tax=Caerostris extrusa TaxID=172846 RepID=A0AAV4X406_CAEEX|nr:hypothetical protein CEXT_362951 [Caerostris extrusa]
MLGGVLVQNCGYNPAGAPHVLPSVILNRTLPERGSAKPHGYCSQGKCVCDKGASGDRCEIIDKCHSKEVDCGTDPTANCTLDDGRVYCKCKYDLNGFDYDKKTCEPCNGRVLRVRIQERKEKVLLQNKILQHRWRKVQRLQKCGNGSRHCSGDTGKKVCECLSPYSQLVDTCEWCDCGVNYGQCSYNANGEKQCKCNEGFGMSKSTKECVEACNDTQPCQNGGTCPEGGACECPDDYTGTWCETPKWCTLGRCGHGGDAECVWDSKSKTGTCKCKEPKHLFVEKKRGCMECDCGENGDCFLQDEMKVCVCKEGYADNFHKCEQCDCGKNAVNCSFAEGQLLCQCKERYAQIARKNDLGLIDVWCANCNCGEHGRCYYYGDDKICACEDNYQERYGTCLECNCGPSGLCIFGNDGKPVCVCDYGYTLRNGKCEPCNCDPPNMRIGSNCTFEKGEPKCECPEGFRENQEEHVCHDINECTDTSICPSNTNCVNIPGQYHYIDECYNSSMNCLYSSTVCVNSPGSYECKCKDGYYPSAAPSSLYHLKRYNNCHEKGTKWRNASIALGVILALGIIGFAFYVYRVKRR